ncbi:uncharacterized protein LOC141632254 [Silene latifolia]|uniref:uncharacterized protein LOC141632254 n=1 Tax=Silene latifolia TaxID=37657 RepID=UPI003D76EC46
MNKVILIENQIGNTCSDSQSIQEAFLDYYESLLGRRKATEKVRAEVIGQGRCCNADHIQILNTPVTNEEIRKIFFDTPIDKSPGPDGYTSAFFKDSWDIIGEDICAAIKDFFCFRCIRGKLCHLDVFLKLTCKKLMIQLNGSLLNNLSMPLGFLRMISYATENWPFQYHPLCKGIKLNHLIFADDLLMFCKGNTQSIMLLIMAFSSFSKAFGLTMNNTKSEVYYNGVSSALKNDIQQATRFVEGSLPFRYLGVPIQAGRLSQKECNALLERMINIIRSIGAKKLSYAGRLVLINSVLNTLYSYWAWMFIIPKGDGSSYYHKLPLVVWDKVTLPKDEGGLGIKKAETCNIAAVAKLVDWVYNKADKLWIKWISQVYLKQQDWHTYTPAAGVVWFWKSICKVKEMMKTGYHNDQWVASSKGYTIRDGYEWLRTKQPK